MTQEEKQLLLIDLCARLPYRVRVKIYDEDVLKFDSEKGTLEGKENMSDDCFTIKCRDDSWIISCDDFKPYLRPMSSMTEEEKKEYDLFKFLGNSGDKYLAYEMSRFVEWLNEHHFDYRGLIEKGLALEATEGMYKEK